MIMAVCDFILAGLLLMNFVNVANGQPFANDFSVGCDLGLHQPGIGQSEGAII